MSTRNENWRNDPDIQLAKQLAAKHGAKIAITLWVGTDGIVGGASYGISRRMCDIGGALLDAAATATEIEMLDFDEFAPIHLVQTGIQP